MGGFAAFKLAYEKAGKKLALDRPITENWTTGATVQLAPDLEAVKNSWADCVEVWLSPPDQAAFAAGPAFSPGLQRFWRSHEFWRLAVILALCVVLSLATVNFLTLQNLFDLLTSSAFVCILASGLLVALIADGIYVSFTATASDAQYVALTLAIRYWLGWFAMFAIAGAIGIGCGAINALFITKLRIFSIIVSIATLNIF